MCGIAGIVSPIQESQDRISAMLGAIVHRGPDDQGVYRDAHIAMGMRRLSIIDLAGGHQPIANEDRTIFVVFNGEIYNYIELRESLIARGHVFQTNSDTEVLVHLYEEYGTEFLNLLNGMFGFAIWDTQRKRLLVARDRLGIKPMYFAETPNALLFASEMKSILATGALQTDLDESALFDYLTLYYIPGEKTPFRQIRRLEPGQLLVAEGGKVSISRW